MQYIGGRLSYNNSLPLQIWRVGKSLVPPKGYLFATSPQATIASPAQIWEFGAPRGPKLENIGI